MRCSYLRDHLKNDGIPMLHMSGELIPADGLTKTLSRVKLESSREKLNVVQECSITGPGHGLVPSRNYIIRGRRNSPTSDGCMFLCTPYVCQILGSLSEDLTRRSAGVPACAGEHGPLRKDETPHDRWLKVQESAVMRVSFWGSDSLIRMSLEIPRWRVIIIL